MDTTNRYQVSALTHLQPIEYYETAAQADARREDATLREALGLPRRDAVAMVMRDCRVTEAFAVVLLDRFAASARATMHGEESR